MRFPVNSSLVMISTAEDLKIRTGWDGKSGKSRSNVLISIEGLPKLYVG